MIGCAHEHDVRHSAGSAGTGCRDSRAGSTCRFVLRHEAQLEAVRRERHSGLAREIVERALSGAEADKLKGFDRERAFDDMERAHREITERL